MTNRLAVAAALTIAALGCELNDPIADGGAGAGGGDAAGATAGSSPTACGFLEVGEPNDTRNTASPYTAASTVQGCIGSGSDIDFYEVTAPADQAGGYFTAAITEVGDGAIEAKVYSASDNSVLLRDVYNTDRGGSLFFYWATAPGQTYRITIERFGEVNSPYRYTLKASYSRIEDAYEPNDTKQQAATVPLGTLTARMFAGFRSSDVALAEYADWYRFEVARAGTLSIEVMDVPVNLAVKVVLHDAGGDIQNSSGLEFNDTPGGPVTVGFPARAAGSYWLGVELRSGRPDAAARTAIPVIPDHFTRPYRLTIAPL